MAKSKKVLIVEDEAFPIDIMQRVIRGLELGLETKVAINVESALNFLNEGNIDLMLLDYNLGNGETTELVARTAYGLEVPFIFTSSLTDAYENVERYGAIRHIPKPFNLDILEAAIKKFYSL